MAESLNLEIGALQEFRIVPMNEEPVQFTANNGNYLVFAIIRHLNADFRGEIWGEVNISLRGGPLLRGAACAGDTPASVRSPIL
ncbi:hypothetical protein NIES3804_29960 [Microcystis aeruginosa NIES-3804]|uniref:Uncharacterized protein n=1 Tax=Microcystis aeruginosa NIES-3804 TaxID=2517783 RepID=A0A6H9GKX6_MICAE|nr:hypothetical protein [Microcystis aeruginosa]GCL51417.1 hypothetical protein NIES3804_29960 [Microcystis aeruginosa NIES-3804]